MSSVLLVMLVLLAAGCSEDGSTTKHPRDFLPPGDASLAQTGEPSIATNDTELNDIINGGWELFATYGFQEMVEQSYTGTIGTDTANGTIQIYDQTDVDNAAAVLEELTIEGSWTAMNGIGTEAYSQQDLGSYTVHLRQDQYVVTLLFSSFANDTLTVMTLMAQHIVQEITS